MMDLATLQVADLHFFTGGMVILGIMYFLEMERYTIFIIHGCFNEGKE